MWSFKKKQKISSLLDLISADLRKLSASKLAYYRAIKLISDAVGRAEIMIQDADGTILKDADYYTLNIRPNPNESGTYFWAEVTKRLLTEGDCLIVPINGSFYIADSYSESSTVMKTRKYSSVTIVCAGQSMPISKHFSEDEVMHIRYDNSKVRTYLDALMSGYDSCIDAVMSMMSLVHRPKFLLKMQGLGSMGTVSIADSKTGKLLSKEAYAQQLLNALMEDKASIQTLSDGIDLVQMDVKASMTPAELTTMIDDVDRKTAEAFGIPWLVFSGTMTEKSNGSNELITYAVQPIASAIDDALNTCVVGEEDYLRGQRITVWLGNFAHRDLVDAASALDKLRGIGFSLDEIREAVGYVPLGTKESTARALTKNYSTEDNTV